MLVITPDALHFAVPYGIELLTEECYKFVHDDAKLGRFFEEDAKLVRRKQDLIEKRDRLSKANAAMANIQVIRSFTTTESVRRPFGV